MRRLVFHTLDVFTDRPFGGNPLAVVLDADGLPAEQMQTICREFNLSETIFVMAPQDAANTAKVRIFFPGGEMPFAGHPTVGCAVLLAEMKHKAGCAFETVIRLEENAGLVPVKVSRIGGASRAEFVAPVIPHAVAAAPPTAADAARAVGLDASDIGFAGHRAGVWKGGPAAIYIPVASRAALARARPSEPHWQAMIASAPPADMAYLYTPGGDHPDTAFRTRMFAPQGGIPEDPATGSAAAILAAQLLANGALKDGANAFRLEQGYEMGRPSDLWMTANARDGAITEVRVAGQAVRMMEGGLAI